MEHKTNIIPIGGNVLLKGIAEVSLILITDNNLPKLQWNLYLESHGKNCEQLESLEAVGTYNVALEYGDNIKQIPDNNNIFSLKAQYDIIKQNQCTLKDKVQIVEYFITPVYNIVAAVKTNKPELTSTVYNLIPQS